VVIRRDKTDGNTVDLIRGGDEIIDLRIREQQHYDERSGRIKGHAHEHKPGKRWSRFFPESQDSSRHVEAVTPPIGKTVKGPHKVPLHRESVRGRAKRKKVEGDELSATLRLQPTMRNEERLIVQKFGPDADGEYQSSTVEHRLGSGPARTRVEGWRP
jgi:hypothetical protein